jgi:LuxR family maltose regulon positive regulatory protein
MKRRASGAAVVSVVAPAGYGKTTAIAQWSSRTRLPTVWLSLDRRDNDPTVLLGYLAAALEAVPGL